MIAFAIHHVDGFGSAVERSLDGVDGAKPASGFAEALIRRPALVTDGLLQAKDRLERDDAQRFATPIGGKRQREVPEEALRRRLDEAPEAVSLRGSRELELRRVVSDDDSTTLRGPTTRLANMRRKDRVGCDLLIAKEAVRSLKLGIIERLRKTLCRLLRKPLGEECDASIQSRVAEVSVS